MENKRKIIVTFTGASSSGKTYLSHLLQGDDFKFLVSDTTRIKRAGEIDGVDYNFLTKEQFQRNLDLDQMLQFNPVNDFMYGVSFNEVVKAFNNNQNGLLVVAPIGVPQISAYCKKHNIRHLSVYIDNPKATLMDRIIDRMEEDLIKKIKPDYKPSLFINSHKESVKEFFNILPYKLIQQHQEDVLATLTEFCKVISYEIHEGYSDKSQKIVDEIVKTYNDRINAMAIKEFFTWVLPAYTGEHKYDLIITQFNQQTQQECLDVIKRKIDEFTRDEQIPEFSTEILDFSNHYEQYLKSTGNTLSPHAVKTLKHKKSP